MIFFMMLMIRIMQVHEISQTCYSMLTIHVVGEVVKERANLKNYAQASGA
jgi:hypothetical protein